MHLRITELLVHGWDLAHATGQPPGLPGDLAQTELELSRAQLGHAPPDTCPSPARSRFPPAPQRSTASPPSSGDRCETARPAPPHCDALSPSSTTPAFTGAELAATENPITGRRGIHLTGLSQAGSPAMAGRVGGRSRLGGCPRAPGGVGGVALDCGLATRSGYRTGCPVPLVAGQELRQHLRPGHRPASWSRCPANA